MEKYNPDIILCSRLPLHPYSILPTTFMNKFDALKYKSKTKTQITEQEEKELNEMYIMFSE